MRQRKYFEYAGLTALLTTFFGFFAVNVADIDFWWHIAAGRNMLEEGIIPSVDPFGVYDAANVWGQTVLKSQWLGQVMLYAVYHWLDINGIIFFRAGILTLCIAIVYLRCRLAATNSPFAFVITALTGLAILHHTGERPQLFSFLYLSLIFLLLDAFARSKKQWLMYCIPLVMLLWSNTHGGSILGIAALWLYSAGYVLENRRVSQDLKTTSTKLLLTIAAISTVTLLLTPNGLITLKYIFFLQNSPLRERVSEYASPWSLWPITMYYWVFICVALVSLPGLCKRSYQKQVAVVVALGVISLTGYRYIPLFVLVAAPYVAASLSRMFSSVKPSHLVNLLVLVISLAFLGYGFKQDRVFQLGVQDKQFPAGAVAFIKSHNLSGKMFNTMNWGGYLIWQLSGTVTPFIDGRMLAPARVVPYTHILWITPDGQRFFEQAGFDLALIPHANAFTRERYPVINYLLNHPDWQVVYQDTAGYLFIRRDNPPM